MVQKSPFLLGCFAVVFTIGLVLSKPTVSVKMRAESAAVPRLSPTATTTPLPNVQLPAWLRDPKAAIVVLFVIDEGPTFLNAETGERFTLKLSYVHDVRWVAAPDGVYIQLARYQSIGADESVGFNEFINLNTGRLVRLPPLDVRAPGQRLPVLLPVDNGSGISYQLVAQAAWVATNDGIGSYQLLTYDDIVLRNTETGSSLSLYGGRMEHTTIYPLFVQWFGKGRFLGVWGANSDRSRLTAFVDIFDTDGNRAVVLTNVGSVRWSATHNLMLYRDYNQDDGTICLKAIVRGDAGDIDCTFLTRWQTQKNSIIRDYHWSRDGQKILFTYEKADRKAGGLCVVDVERRAIQCPFERRAVNGNFGISYNYMPENAYGILRYLNVLPQGDAHDTTTPQETGLCLVSQSDYSVDCITDRRLPANTYSDDYSRSPSGNMVAFTYTGQAYERHDGVCIVQLQSGIVNCTVPSQIVGYIERISWSPDNRFLLIMHTAYGPLSDDKTETQYGIINVATGTYRDEGTALHENGLDPLWRPALNP